MTNRKSQNPSKKISIFGHVLLLIISASILDPYEQQKAEKGSGSFIAPVTKEFTGLMRTVGYSGAATSLIIILSILQIGASAASLKVSVASSSVALPLWLVSGLIYESYLSLDSSLFPHQKSPLAKIILPFIQLTAAGAMLLSLVSLLYHIWPVSAWIMIVMIVISVFVLLIFNLSIICYWLAQLLKSLFNIDLFQRIRDRRNHSYVEPTDNLNS